MAQCYWEQCTCPENEPCSQHSGYGCGYWNGILIQNPTQVSDALTRDAELAITALDANQDEIEDIRAQLVQKKADLENEQTQISDGLNNRGGIGRRRQTVRRIEQAYRRLSTIHTETQQVLTDLDSIDAQASSAGAMIAMSLIIPYTSASGYCSCYETKRQRLAAIATEIARQQARLTPLFARKNDIRQEIFRSLSTLPTRDTVLRRLGSITFLAAIIAFILLGLAAAFWAAVAGLLLIALVLLDTVIALVNINKQILVIRQNIVRLNLSYYRIQSITTCSPTPLKTSRDNSSWHDENAWYRAAILDLPAESEEDTLDTH